MVQYLTKMKLDIFCSLNLNKFTVSGCIVIVDLSGESVHELAASSHSSEIILSDSLFVYRSVD